jgi:hypothetical protein
MPNLKAPDDLEPASNIDLARDPGAPGKVADPHVHFEHPAEIVADPSLSMDEKKRALSTLEQDAKQLAAAEAEGMGGGEANKLQEVMDAKDSLALPPSVVAFAVARQIMMTKLVEAEGTQAHIVIAEAVAAVEAATAAIADMPSTGKASAQSAREATDA